MADLGDVLRALRDAVSQILYPNGVPGGAMPQSAAGAPARVYVGWPDASLDADLKAGIVQVTIWPRSGMTRDVGPFLTGWKDQQVPVPSMAATVEGDTATFAGTGAVSGMIAAVLVDRVAAYTYPLLPGDGPEQVAAALAALVAADRPATASGAALTVPDAFALTARVVSSGTERRELRRLSQSIQISAWAPSGTLRDAVIRMIDEALLEEYRTLALPDGSVATIEYEGTGYDEEARQQPLHRRDLFVSAEYSTARTRSVPGIAVPVVEYETDPAVIRRTILS